jgi:benzoate-CoA ligase
MYAGLVPVAVNTLLTADDYAYMLEHSRAQAVLVSGALLPALTAAMTKSTTRCKSHRVAPGRAAAPVRGGVRSLFAGANPLAKPAATGPDDPGFWLYSSGSTGRPKGTVHSHGNPYWTAELYGKACWPAERRVLFGGQAVFCLWPGQCADLPHGGGGHHHADGRAPHAGRHLPPLARRGGG